jgi:charged multivesicular body protein 3
MKVKKSIKDAAKRGQVDVAKILAKEVVQSKKAVSKLYASKAQMNSVVMSMQQQLG